MPVWSNTGWNNGLKKWTKTYKNDNGELKLIKQVTNNYKKDERIYTKVYSYNFIILFSWPIPNFSYTCKQEDINRYYEFNNCIANHNHWWGSNGCIAPGHKMESDFFYHPCYGFPPDTTITNLKNHVDYLGIVEYENHSFWHYNDATTTVEYFDGANASTTSYLFFDNPSHGNLTRTETTNSKNELVKTTTTYADDIADPSDVFTNKEVIDSLKARYMTSLPLKTEKFVNGEKVKGQITSYNLFNNKRNILPEQTRILEGNSYEIRDNFKYDIRGNPVQYHKEDNIFITYLWGYNHSYPIAKIENAEFDFVGNLLNCSYEVLQNKSSQELESIMDNLRNKTELENAMVYSSTYDPLVGMISETGPDGKTTTYQYDEFNRLETIRDDRGNVIKHVDYHYYEPE